MKYLRMMEIQLELEIDHEDSLDHWAALLADREVGSRTYDSDWQMHYDKLLAQFRCRIQLRYSQTIGGERWEE